MVTAIFFSVPFSFLFRQSNLPEKGKEGQNKKLAFFNQLNMMWMFRPEKSELKTREFRTKFRQNSSN